MNIVILIGRLTSDPDPRYTPNGVAVTRFTVAVDRQFKNSNGEKETDFINIVTWRKLAENCANYLTKGSLVAVEGRLQIRSYEDSQGIKRKAAEVIAENVRFLDSRKGDAYEPNNQQQVNDDDVPF